MEHRVFESIVMKFDKEERKEQRSLERQAQREERQRQRDAQIVIHERDRRLGIAQIEQLLLVSDKVLGIFAKFSDQIETDGRILYTPTIAVEKGKLPTREKELGIVGVKLNLVRDSQAVFSYDYSIQDYAELDGLDRLSTIERLGASVYKLPFDEDQTVGEVLRDGASADRTILADSAVRPSNAANFVQSAGVNRHQNRTNREQYEMHTVYNHRKMTKQFYKVVDALADVTNAVYPVVPESSPS